MVRHAGVAARPAAAHPDRVRRHRRSPSGWPCGSSAARRRRPGSGGEAYHLLGILARAGAARGRGVDGQVRRRRAGGVQAADGADGHRSRRRGIRTAHQLVGTGLLAAAVALSLRAGRQPVETWSGHAVTGQSESGHGVTGPQWSRPPRRRFRNMTRTSNEPAELRHACHRPGTDDRSRRRTGRRRRPVPAGRLRRADQAEDRGRWPWSRSPSATCSAAAPRLRPNLLIHTLVGAGLVAAGGSALNHWLERRADARMRRTADRGRCRPGGSPRPEVARVRGRAGARRGGVPRRRACRTRRRRSSPR